jgi:hypothetical protein
MIFWLVLKLEISYNRVIISWRIFWRLYFCMVKYSCLHKSSFALGYFFAGHSVTHPLIVICKSSTFSLHASPHELLINWCGPLLAFSWCHSNLLSSRSTRKIEIWIQLYLSTSLPFVWCMGSFHKSHCHLYHVLFYSTNHNIVVSQVAKLITFHILVESKMVALKYPHNLGENIFFPEWPKNPNPTTHLNLSSHFKLN